MCPPSSHQVKMLSISVTAVPSPTHKLVPTCKGSCVWKEALGASVTSGDVLGSSAFGMECPVLPGMVHQHPELGSALCPCFFACPSGQILRHTGRRTQVSQFLGSTSLDHSQINGAGALEMSPPPYAPSNPTFLSLRPSRILTP